MIKALQEWGRGSIQVEVAHKLKYYSCLNRCSFTAQDRQNSWTSEKETPLDGMRETKPMPLTAYSTILTYPIKGLKCHTA